MGKTSWVDGRYGEARSGGERRAPRPSASGRLRPASRWGGVLAWVLGLMMVASAARAGELLLGAEPLATDDAGKVTQAARTEAIQAVEASPGDEMWTLHIWARIDKAAVGPLYLEFYRERVGKRLVAFRHELPDYGGDKYLSMELDITRSDGFKPGETVEMAFVQNVGGRDATKAKATVTLKPSMVEPEPEPEAEPEPEPEPEPEAEPDVSAASDIEAQPASEPGPPPVTSGDKKGCAVGGSAGAAWALCLPVLGWALRRRRR